jgi:hypothetical protein
MNEFVMHNQSLLDLDWQPAALVNVSQQSLTHMCYSLYINRVYLALHPDGVVCAAWDVPPTERMFPRVHLVGWKPSRDVPFELPVRFERKGDPRISSTIPNGTWVLPYDPNTYSQLEQVQTALQQAIDHARAILSNVVR